MHIKKITLLNAAILTNYGKFDYHKISLEKAKEIVKNCGEVQSAIGHESTAYILTDLLEYPIKQNRIEYKQKPGETALIFRLKSRPPEGVVLIREELEKIGYEFGTLKRTE
jgi:hypothetical protein